tara:strand:+ start:1461 stop:1769 length:309 start_codon:yes stop_codon:yes gene_type:complete
MITLGILLFLSVCLNILVVWYAKKLTNQFTYFSDNIADIEGIMISFSNHLNGVHELETFYGDETLHSLMQHSKNVIEEIKEFNNLFSMNEGDEEEEDIDEII